MMPSSKTNGEGVVRSYFKAIAALAVVVLAGCSHAGSLVPSTPGAANQADTQLPASSSLNPAAVTPDTPPATILMKHVLTWQDLATGDGNRLSSWSQAAPWLTIANTTAADSGPMHAAGLLVAFYTNPNRQGPGAPLYSTDETTFAHDCSGNRMQSIVTGADLMDPHSTHLGTMWNQYVQKMIGNGAHVDYVFEDNADDIYNVTGTPCNFVQADWTAASNSLDNALGNPPIIYNALSHTSTLGGVIALAPAIALNATAAGGMSEDCYTTHTQLLQTYLGWQAKEDTEITMALAGKTFVCNASMTSDAASSVAIRLYQYASFLMTYEPKISVYDANFTGSYTGLKVFPEVQLVPKRPVLAEPATVAALLQSGGAYGRQYGACYFKGNYVGPCAAVVNSNKIGMAAVPFPWPSTYDHTLTMSGYGVLDGGTATVRGPRPPAALPAGTAVIATR